MRPRVLAPLALAALALAFPGAARADDAALLFDPATVAQVDLTLSEEARQALLDDPSTYVAATFGLTVGDQAFAPRPAQVKLKGHGSFRPLGEKAAFKVKFAKTNRLLGLKALTLNNMVQDKSMLHETLGYEVFRAAGVPAPRTGFAYVKVNGLGYGLYLNLETYDDISAARLFATTQHLYEADDYGVDVTPGGAGAYEVEEGDEDDRTDLEALIAAVNATGSDWSEGMAGSADLDEMTRMWAGERYLGHWDGYSVGNGANWPNNYYLHSDAAGRFSMLPSGLDASFEAGVPLAGHGDGLLITRCLGDSSCLQDFRANLGEASAAADTMGIGTRLNAIAATVARWRRCPNLGQAGDASWQGWVLAARAFIRDRRIAVADYLGVPPPATDPALQSTAPPPLSAAGCPLTPEPPQDDPEPEPEQPGPRPAGAAHTTAPATSAAVSPGAAVLGSRGSRLRPPRVTASVSASASAPYRFTTSGSLVLPSGLSRARACTGRVTVRIRAGRRTLSLRELFLRKNCSFSSSVAFRDPSLFAGRTRLTVQVRFMGNDLLLPRAAGRRTVAVRPRAPARSASRGGS